jgi:hypothetical protein
MLRDIKPLESGVDAFLRATNVDLLLDEVSKTLRQAGAGSRLSNRAGLLPAPARQVPDRYYYELQSVIGATRALVANPAGKRTLAREILSWATTLGLNEEEFGLSDFEGLDLGDFIDVARRELRSELPERDLNRTLEHDQDIHFAILDLGWNESYVPVLSNDPSERERHKEAARSAIDRMKWIHTDTFTNPVADHLARKDEYGHLSWGGSHHFPLDEEYKIFILHRNLVHAILRGDSQSATDHIVHHFSWLW